MIAYARRHLREVLAMAALVSIGIASSSVEVAAASLINCTMVTRSTSAYWYKEGLWTDLDPLSGQRMSKGTYFREHLPRTEESYVPIGFLFSQLDQLDVVVKQLYPDGSAGMELRGTVVHRTSDSVLVLWPLPLANEMRLALINTNAKRAVISVMGAGIVALGVSAGLADCQ
jgi:hypothetical protein